MANLIHQCPIPLVLKKILKDRLDGILEVKRTHFCKRLFFNKGHLHFATSNFESDRLGNILFKKGYIDEILLLSLDRFSRDKDEKIGKFLIKKKFISKAELFQGLIHQIISISTSTFNLQMGEWEFLIKKPKLAPDENFNINMVWMIQEGIYRIGDISYYENLFAHKSPVRTTIPESIGRFLKIEEIKFFGELSKYSNQTNEQILAKMEISRRLYWQMILVFYILNLLDFAEYGINKNLNEKMEQIDELHKSITSGKGHPFELFGLDKTINTEEARQYLESISQELDPDTIVSAPNSEIKKKAVFILEEVYKMIEKIQNGDQKNGRESAPPKADGNQDGVKSANMAKRDMIKKARKLYIKAHHFYYEEKYQEAVILLQEAIKLVPDRSKYYLLLGLSQSKIPALRSSAETNLKKVAEMEPWNADPVFYLGELYRSENLKHKAEECFKLALEINMDHTLAGQKIQTGEKKSLREKLKLLTST